MMIPEFLDVSFISVITGAPAYMKHLAKLTSTWPSLLLLRVN